jgi:hypothetical protein
MNLTKKQINLIIEKTKEELKGTQTHIGTTLGYYQKSGANWSYIAGWTNDGELVATVFGEVQ